MLARRPEESPALLLELLADLSPFWGEREMRSLHQPVGYVSSATMPWSSVTGACSPATCSVRGVSRVEAITGVDNVGSRAFHARLGFDEQVVPDYAGPGLDRVLFRLALADPDQLNSSTAGPPYSCSGE